MTPDLPESYYLDNVLTLFEQVESLYADILEPAQLGFLQTFAALSEDAKKLYIRLLNRNHLCFRQGKLSYAEIGSIDDAINELEQAGCLRVNAELDGKTLLSLFSKPELLELSEEAAALKKLKRAELDAYLLQQDDLLARLAEQHDWLLLEHQDEYRLCQMLFFGNLRQSMTDFVLRDLGLNQYEAYPIDTEHRPYRSQLEIQQHWLLQQLETLLELEMPEDEASLLEYFALIPDDIASDAPAWHKGERLRYQLARQMERCGYLAAALPLYQACLLPPSRERIARIHAQQHRPQQSLELCLEMIAEPLDESEAQFACQFAARLIRRHDFDAEAMVEANRISHQPEVVELELAYQDSVEIAVAEYYDAQDGHETCYYLENSLFNGVLGLLLWEVIFAALPGAFFNPFQYRPTDLYAHDFFDRRADLFDQLWAGINSNEDIRVRALNCWQEKYGLMNPLVNWQALSPELIELALQRIEHGHWMAIFRRQLADLGGNRSGFPDLVHFPDQGGYCLVEVKGPGDSLQKNQQRWMQYFQQQGIPHRLAKVTWQPA